MSSVKTAIVIFLGVLGASTTVLATLDNQKTFLARYPRAKATLGKCTTYHTKALPKKNDHESNAYGKDLAKNVLDAKAKKKQYDFAKVEALDSDGDGVKNVDEIKAGTNPGDPKSKVPGDSTSP
jgi:hypothetical protein